MKTLWQPTEVPVESSVGGSLRSRDGLNKNLNEEIRRTEVSGGTSKTIYKQHILRKIWGYPDLNWGKVWLREATAVQTSTRPNFCRSQQYKGSTVE